MVSEGTLALLSACKFLLKDKELAIARGQIRMTIGCLRGLGETWPRIARNVQEIQIIARHALGLNAKDSSSSTPSTTDVPRLSLGDQGNTSSRSYSGSSGIDIFSSIGDLDGVCGWYDFGDLGLVD
jgi:hypothetical protein